MARDPPFGPGEQTCCGVVQQAHEKRAQRRSNSIRQPWIVLKLAVIISVAIIGYISYVYVGRFCVPMLKRTSHALGSLTFGIAFQTVFSLLLIMTLWSYAKVVLTPPGYAKDYVKTTSRPEIRRWDSNTDIEAMSYEYHQPINPPQQAHSTSNIMHGTSVGVSPSKQHHTGHPHDDFMMPQPKSNRPLYSRRPPMTPILLPEYRYCNRENLVKPLRAHHCRACGYCVLRYDHHCPWIGQCVGAHNHKFFVIFLQWTFLFCVWVFATLIALNVRSRPAFSVVIDVDPQQIVSMVLSGIFGLFTGTMFFTHVRLIRLNVSTVEHVKISNMKERESELLGQMFKFYHFGEKRRTIRNWDHEWGRLTKEGNIWWLGNARTNWESTMGKNVWWWFLPIGRSENDGLNYPVNPRFDTQGRWRRRSEWPAELR